MISKYGTLLRSCQYFEPKTLSKHKRQIQDDYHCLLNAFLQNYGIKTSGYTFIRNAHTKEDTDIRVLFCIIDKEIPYENFLIIQKMYDYSNALVDISILSYEMYAISFTYNSFDKSLILKELRWGEAIQEKKYNSFAEMMDDLKTHNFELSIFNAQYSEYAEVIPLLS